MKKSNRNESFFLIKSFTDLKESLGERVLGTFALKSTKESKSKSFSGFVDFYGENLQDAIITGNYFV